MREDLLRVEATLRRASDINDLEGFQNLSEYLDHILKFGGKQVRPALTLLASRFHTHDTALSVFMASAIELLHIATLVHDDTIDKASVRRGRPTVSSVWGKDVAVLLGDYAFAKSATFACDTGSVRVVKLFSEAIMALSAGELREFVTLYDNQQNQAQYENRIRDKTASLFKTAAETGAILSGAPEEDIEALRTYGYNLGMAFQVVDDLLDFEGTEEVLGKPVGGDLAQGVMTLPSILMTERDPSDATIKAVFASPEDPEALRAAVQKIRACGAMEEAAAVAQAFSERACDALATLPDITAKASLLAIAEYVLRRDR